MTGDINNRSHHVYEYYHRPRVIRIQCVESNMLIKRESETWASV